MVDIARQVLGESVKFRYVFPTTLKGRAIVNAIIIVSDLLVKKIDEFFIDFICKIRPYQVSEASEPSTINHCVVIHYITMSNETGSSVSIRLEPRACMVYFKCKASDRDRAMQKPDASRKDDKIQFVMEISVQEMRLDEALFRRQKSNWEGLAMFIAQNKDEVKEAVESEEIERFGRNTALVSEV
jgi:dsDNA-binding SOS-regulon protein